MKWAPTIFWNPRKRFETQWRKIRSLIACVNWFHQAVVIQWSAKYSSNCYWWAVLAVVAFLATQRAACISLFKNQTNWIWSKRCARRHPDPSKSNIELFHRAAHLHGTNWFFEQIQWHHYIFKRTNIYLNRTQAHLHVIFFLRFGIRVSDAFLFSFKARCAEWCGCRCSSFVLIRQTKKLSRQLRNEMCVAFLHFGCHTNQSASSDADACNEIYDDSLFCLLFVNLSTIQCFLLV